MAKSDVSFDFLQSQLRQYNKEDEEKNRKLTEQEISDLKAKSRISVAKEEEKKVLGDGETVFTRGIKAKDVIPELRLQFEKRKFKTPYYLQV